MKNQSNSLVCIFVFMWLSFSACTKSHGDPPDNTGTVSFVIDGGGFNNQQITIDGRHSGNDQVYYSSIAGISIVEVDDAPNRNTDPKNAFMLLFNGNATGQQAAGDVTPSGQSRVSFQVGVTDKNGVPHFFVFTDKATTPGAISITQYGAVGNTVKGTFSGELTGGIGPTDIKITNGSFSLIRVNDID